MSSFISRIHTALREARLTRKNATKRPEEVQTGLSKEYQRMKRILLSQPRALPLSLEAAIEKRMSFDECRSPRPASWRELSDLLGHALQSHKGSRRRHYPSGGALFPIETYLIGNVVKDEKPGVYHYRPQEHALERLWDADVDMGRIFRGPDTPSPPILIVFSAVWERGSAKYGDFNYYHALIECGHMAQNLLLVGTALGMAMRPHSGFTDEVVAEYLDIDQKREQVVYSLMLCPSNLD